jgi:Rrf2 family protein
LTIASYQIWFHGLAIVDSVVGPRPRRSHDACGFFPLMEETVPRRVRCSDGLSMKLSRSSTYAIQAALELAQSETDVPVACSQLAANCAMPSRFLLQILHRLVAHGILTSTRGTLGGYELRRSPERISLLDLVEATDGPLVDDKPTANLIVPAAEKQVRLALNRATRAARTELARTTLADLLGD